MRARVVKGAYVLVAAISVGWLVGLSASPVVNVVVGSVIALVVAIVSALSGIQSPSVGTGDDSKDESTRFTSSNRLVTLNPVPVAIFAVGLAVGATVGLVARTNEVFGPNKAMFVRRWQGTGLTDVEIKRRLFDQLYDATPSQGSKAHDGDTKPPQGNESRSINSGEVGRRTVLTAGLFAVSAEDCQLLAARHGADLRARLLLLEGDPIKTPLQACHSDDCLEAIKAILCPK
jgi:hypothetical protein